MFIAEWNQMLKSQLNIQKFHIVNLRDCHRN